MPIYQYQCTDCGHEVEALQKFSDAPLTDCPSCGNAALRKKLTAAAFHLKGTGWYVTDFRDKGKKPESAKSGKSEAEKPSGPAADKAAAAPASTAAAEK